MARERRIPSAPNTEPPLHKRLHQDQGGAILIIGLMASLSLIGALWILIGIGNSILTHDLGQEAADAAALSSATVHARAMNATGAINFVMLVLTGSYLCFSVLCDSILSVAAFLTFDRHAIGKANGFANEGLSGFRRLIQFEQGMGRTFTSLDRAQTSLAVAGPYLGASVGQDAANNYNFNGMTMGWSNFSGAGITRRTEVPPYSVSGASVPQGRALHDANCHADRVGWCGQYDTLGGLLISPPGFTLGNMSGLSLGLPVASEPTPTLCVRTGGVMFATLGQVMSATHIPTLSNFIQLAIGGYGTALPLGAHCTDAGNNIIAGGVAGAGRGIDVWSLRGPKRMTAPNGDMVMRVLGWAISKDDKVADDSLRRVRLGAYEFGGAADLFTPTYNSQAEFYYDCDAGWHAGQCNDDEIAQTGVGYEHSLYWMRWRARLVRSKTPDRVFDTALNAVVNLGQRVADAAAIPGNVWPRLATHVRTQGNNIPVPNLH